MSYFVFLMCFLFFNQVEARSPQEIVQLALAHSEFISVSELEQKAIEFDAIAKKKWQNPQVMTQIGGLKTGTMSGETIELTITQPIPLNQKYSLRGKLADKLGEINALDIQSKKNWVSHQAILSAWKVKIYSALGKHINERKERMRLAKIYISKRPQVTAKHIVEAQIIGNQIRILENSLLMNLAEIEMAQSELEYWTGVKISPDELDFSFPKLNELNFNQQFVAKKNLETVVAEKRVEIASLDSQMSKKEKFPDLIIGGGYRVEKVSPENHFSYGMLGISIPIWDTGENRVQAANARLKKEEKVLVEKKKSVEMEIGKYQSMMVYFKGLFSSVFFDDVNEQEKILGIAENGFKQGVIDINTFLQTEVQTHEIIDQIYLNWMKYLETVSHYNLTTGEELKWTR